MLRILTLTLLPSAALAQDAAANAAAGSPYASLMPLALIFVVFYFLLIKPQQKRMKEQQAMLGALKKGDEVVTGGGFVGRITKVDGDRVSVEIAKGVEVVVLKSTISALAGVVTVVATPTSGKKNPAVKNDNVTLKKEQIANDN